MSEKILMKGNEALAEAAIQAGCRHYFGYPITPQNEITAYMAKRLPEIGGSFLQAESEVAAINMVYGAAGAGKRVLTSSSSPGISLKVEGISYIAGADLPAVIVNIQRGGPGLGGIQPSQADYFQAVKGGGHGDYKMVVLAPSSVQEMADLTVKAFDLADKYRIPVFIFADGAMGQMMEPVTLNYPEQKVYEKPWALTGTKEKRAKNIVNSLYLVPEQLEEQILARFERYKEIENTESACDEYLMDDAEICVVGYGVAARVARSAVNEARAKGIKAGLLRPVTLWPFPQQQLKKAAEKVKAFICAEHSMGQMIEDVRLYSECKKPVHLCARTGGVILTPKEVLNKIEEINYDSTR